MWKEFFFFFLSGTYLYPQSLTQQYHLIENIFMMRNLPLSVSQLLGFIDFCHTSSTRRVSPAFLVSFITL